jgi:thymidylate synthase
LARLELNPEISVITDFEMEDIELADYQSHDAIKAPMAV